MPERKTMSIFSRTIGVALTTGAERSNYLLLNASAQRLGITLNAASVPDSFSQPNRGLFDHEYMQALFEFGAERAKNGSAFRDAAAHAGIAHRPSAVTRRTAEATIELPKPEPSPPRALPSRLMFSFREDGFAPGFDRIADQRGGDGCRAGADQRRQTARAIWAACPPDVQTPPTVGGPSSPNLSEKLADSKGVICPPAGVDPEIRVPPPGGGELKVIPPPGTPGGNPDVQPK